MKRYTTVHPLYMSFFSKDLYRDVGSNWKWISFLYLLLLLALSWIPFMFKVQSKLNDFIADEAPKLIRQIPEITIKKGEATVAADMPYIIKEPGRDAPLVIIDTTGKVNSLENSKAKALLTKRSIIIKNSEVETRTIDLAQFGDLVINQSKVYDWAETLRKIFAFIAYPFLLFFSYLYRIVQVLLYALIGMLFSKILRAGLNYQSLVSLSIAALTPAIIINAIYNYSDLRIPFWYLICFIIAMNYLWFAVKANAEKEPELK